MLSGIWPGCSHASVSHLQFGNRLLTARESGVVHCLVYGPIPSHLFVEPITVVGGGLETVLLHIAEPGYFLAISEGVSGSVNLNATHMLRMDALDEVLSQVGATFRIENNTIWVSRKGEAPDLRIVQEDSRAAIRRLFRDQSVRFSIDPGVQGSVTADLTGLNFQHALTKLCRQLGAYWRVESDVYQIIVGRTYRLGLDSDGSKVIG